MGGDGCCTNVSRTAYCRHGADNELVAVFLEECL